MRSRVFVFTLSVLLVLSSLSGLGLASPGATAPTSYMQSDTGRLVGTVSGPDGVIVGATVTVTDNQTGKEYKAVTNDSGGFTLPQLNVGTYTVKVTATGFKTYTATELRIDVDKEYGLNAMLQVGSVDETVTVTAGAEIINSTTGELSNTVESRQIKELPLNGRNPLSLIGLQAGTSQNGATGTVINGQRVSFTSITRDGINIQDNFIRSNATDFVPDRPNVDDVAEFTIVTQNAGAELGYGASQIQLVTPRGSNAYHGSLFEYNRNSELTANSFFRNAAKIQKPFLNRNQFGGNFGGPLKKNKLFFFGAVEIFKLRTSSLIQDTVLLPSARGGVFTYKDSAGAVHTANILSLAGVTADSTIQSRILGPMPGGNSSALGDGLNTTGFLFNQAGNQDREAVTYRTDYEINSKQSMNAVFSYKHENNLRPDVDNGGFGSTPFSNQDANTYFFAIAHNWTATANFTNEARGGYQSSDPKFDRSNQPSNFFLSIPLVTSPEVTFQKQGRNTGIYNGQDNAVWAKGAHSFRFGGQWSAYRINPYGPPAFANSSIPTLVLGTNTNTPALSASQLPGISSTQLTTANNLLALLGGIVGSANLTFNASSQTSGYVPGFIVNRQLNYSNISGYFSDQWRIKPNLTVNAGLRYELFTPITEPDGLALEPVIGGANSQIAALLDPGGSYNFVGTNLGGKKFFKVDKNNFAPVLSAAYSPNFKNGWISKLFPGDGKTVIRGGFRVSYVNDEFTRAADNAVSGNAGLTNQVSLINLNGRAAAGPPAFATPAFLVPRSYALNNSLAGNFATVFGIDQNLQVPATTEFNFGIERSLGWQTALEIRYVGGRSTNLVRGLDLNQVDIRGNGFAADFIRARANLVLTGNASCTSAGCQPLTVFPNLVAGGLLTNSTVKSQILAGTAADLAIIYVQNGLTGNVRFLANPNTGVVDFLTNSARYNYNSVQVELRHRFNAGLYFQANYTFQKTLTDAPGVGQTNFDPLLDNLNPGLDYARADFDQTHVFNANFLYELPFGSGKRFLSNTNKIVDRIIGGFEMTSIFRASTGAPMTIVDPRGTLNRAGRSARQTPITPLSVGDLQNLTGVFVTGNGVFFINPSVINTTGRGSEGFGTPAFPGQVFFNNPPGATGGLTRMWFNGPNYFDWDASLIKNIRIKESTRLQLRIEAFNTVNKVNFFASQIGGSSNINSTTFGKITSDFGPRIIQLVGRFEF